MAIYKYVGLDLNGKRIKNQQNSSDVDSLKAQLKNRGITLLTYKEVKEKRRNNFFAVSSKVKQNEFVSFCQQFAIMLESGVTICDSLDVLRKQNFGTVFKNAISDVYESVLTGKSLSLSFASHPKIFPRYFCSLISVGELSGGLSTTLRKASDYYQNDNKIKKRVRSAMIYPIFLLIMTLGICLFLMIFVVPTFEDIIKQFNGEVPLLTTIVVNISNFIVDNVIVIIVCIVAFIILLMVFNQTKAGKYVKAALGYNLPVFKTVTKNTISSRFCMSLGILVQSGMPIVTAMKELPEIISNPYFSKKFIPVIEEVNKGKRLYRSLENMHYFPSSLIQVIKVGEETSNIDKVCNVMADFYKEELDTSITRATSLLEPVVIVILGVIVGIVILSVLLPMLAMESSIGGI